MKSVIASLVLVMSVTVSPSPVAAQLVAAKSGPIVNGHHHVWATSVDEHKKIAFITDPWGTYIELTEGLSSVP